MVTLRLMREQGVFKGDLTPLQRYALRLASISTDEVSLETSFSLVKAMQAFVNPTLFQKVYAETQEEDESDFEPEDYQIDMSSPEELDDYLEKLYSQREHINTHFVDGQQELAVTI